MPKVHILFSTFWTKKGLLPQCGFGKIKRKDKKRVGKLVS